MVTNEFDQLLIACDLFPAAGNHTNAAERLIRWLDDLPSTADNRTTPVIVVDLND